MNILPQQLIGKVVKDCYQDYNGEVIIEFTDGTKIKVVYEDIYHNNKGGNEVSIHVIV